MIGEANHYGSRFAAQKQGRHFAWRRNPAETQRLFQGIMIGKANHYGSRFAAQKQGRHFAWRRNPAETQRLFQGIMIGKANHYGSRFAAQKQGRHFAWRQNPAETQRIFQGIMIGKAKISTGLCQAKLRPYCSAAKVGISRFCKRQKRRLQVPALPGANPVLNRLVRPHPNRFCKAKLRPYQGRKGVG